MAQHSYSTGRSRGNRGRGIDSRGKRGSAPMGGYYGESNYQLRSRDTGQQSYYSNEYSGRYSGNSEYQEERKGIWKGNPKNKNTNVEYFWRTQSPFSQFHPANFEVNNERFVCAEQYMMWNKARVFGDYRSQRLIMQTKEPKIMKKYGRGVENFDPDIWDMCCRQIVQEGNTAKFSQNCALLEKFLLTESKYFAEASPGDKKWGIGMEESHPNSNNPDSWRGSNWLGEALNTVKHEFQLIIFLTMNGEYIKQAPKSNLLDLFKIGTCEYFEKMKCDILISEGKEEIFIDAPSRNRSGKGENKKYKQTKIESKTNEKVDILAPSFDVPLPKCSTVQIELLDNTELENLTENIETVEITKTTSSGENISDEKGGKIGTGITAKDESIIQSESTQSLSNSGGDESKVIQKCEIKEKLKDSKQIDDFVPENKESKKESKKDTPIEYKQKQSPSSKRKFQSQEYTQEKLNFKPAKITFDAMPVPKTKVPNSKRISCEYIFIDWARAKICDDLTILNSFMRLSIEEIRQLTGNFVYQTNKEVIGIDITVSSLLIELQKEFSDLEIIFKNYSFYMKDFDCATKIPNPPSLKGRVAIDTPDIWLTQTQPDIIVRKNIRTSEDKSVLFITENKKVTQDEPDQIAKNTELPLDIMDIPIAKNTELPLDITDIPITKNIEMVQEKLDNVKILATDDTQIENPVNPSAGETETENIPVKSDTEEVGTDILQESSNIKPENEQETINVENTQTANQQETINEESTETGNQQENINEKNIITENQQETINEKNPIAGKDQENVNTGNLESEKEQDITLDENTETNINQSYNTSVSEMEVSTELKLEAKSDSPLLDQDIIKEEQKPKINKKSPSQSLDETDTAKRPKHDTQTCKQLVSYDSSSNSDQDSAENKKKQTGKIRSKTGKKHTSSDENNETKRAKSEPQPEINLESSSPVENEINEDDPKEKPADIISDKPIRGKKKKKNKTTIYSSGLH